MSNESQILVMDAGDGKALKAARSVKRTRRQRVYVLEVRNTPKKSNLAVCLGPFSSKHLELSKPPGINADLC